MTRKNKDRNNSRSSRRIPMPDADYEVGYGRPPAAHQFKAGQSGNPKGRPKGRKNMKQMFEEIMEELAGILQQPNGTSRKISRKETMLRKIASKATSGEPKQVKLALDMLNSGSIESEPSRPLSSVKIVYVKPDPRKEEEYRARYDQREEAERREKAAREEQAERAQRQQQTKSLEPPVRKSLPYTVVGGRMRRPR